VNVHIDLSHIAQAADQLDMLLGGDDDERLFHDMLVGETDIDHMVLRVHEQIASDEEMLVGITQREASLNERKQRIAARKDAAKALIGKILRAGHLLKLELPEVTYSVRDGKPSLRVVDPDAVPDAWQRIKREPDKAAINKDWTAAETLPNWLVREPARDVVTARTK
jgi:hypothetical protein